MLRRGKRREAKENKQDWRTGAGRARMHNTHSGCGTDRKEAQPTAKPAGSERGAYVIAGPRGRCCFYRFGLFSLPPHAPRAFPLPARRVIPVATTTMKKKKKKRRKRRI